MSISALAGYENNSESLLKVTVKSISIGKTQQNKNPYQSIHYLIMSLHMVSFPCFCSLFLYLKIRWHIFIDYLKYRKIEYMNI